MQVIGPAMMKNSKAYELRPIILLYNAAMVVANLSIASYVGYHAFWTGEFVATSRTTIHRLFVEWGTTARSFVKV